MFQFLILNSKERGKKNLFFNELGEESFRLNWSDVSTVITPDEDPAFDVKEEQRGRRPCHVK